MQAMRKLWPALLAFLAVGIATSMPAEAHHRLYHGLDAAEHLPSKLIL
jgi:hypothetical protein